MKARLKQICNVPWFCSKCLKFLLGIHVCTIYFTLSTWKVWLDIGEVQSVFAVRMTLWLSSAYPVHGRWSVNKVNRSSADVASLVLSFCHFHPIVEQLTVFWYHWTHSPACCSLLPSESSIMISIAPWAACARNVFKLCIYSYISIVNKQTYKSNFRLRPH